MEVGPSAVWQTCLVVFWYSLWVVYWVGRSETVAKSQSTTVRFVSNGFSVFGVQLSNSDRLQALYVSYNVSNYKSKRV